jgi:hypothetical protein
MASKSSKPGPTDDELLAELDQLGTDVQPASKPTTSKGANKKATGPSQEEQDILAELDKLDTLAQERPKSRPHTPRASGNVSSTAPVRTSIEIASGRNSEDRATAPPRRSTESARTYHQGFTPDDTGSSVSESTKKVEASSGGGWWGGIMATATAAVTQAQAIAKDLQNNEEAQKWAEQVKGNVGVLRNYGKWIERSQHYGR